MNLKRMRGWNITPSPAQKYGHPALTEALYLAEICNKVYIVHRRDTFRAEDIWVEQARKVENIEFVLNEEVEEISGKFFVEEIKLKSGKVKKVVNSLNELATGKFTM